MTFDAAPSIEGLAHAFRTRQISSEQVTASCLNVIAAHNPQLNAFIEVFADSAMQQARDADVEIAAGRDRGPLHGVPVALKDLIDVQGFRTTAASHVRDHHVAFGDALIVGRLREAGAVFLGKNNLHEFALGTTNEDSAFGPARHPLDPMRSPGGSSGGSAAAVASGMSYAAVGTDTGGSVRIPASLCGLVGLKPTFGEIPLAGVVPLSTTLDHAGPLCRSVADARVLYEVMRGVPAAARAPVSIRESHIGVLRGYFDELLDPEVATAFELVLARLRDTGATLCDVRIGHSEAISPVYVHLALTEGAAYHAPTLERQPLDYTPNVRQRLEVGRYINGEDYVRAQHGRAVLRAEVNRVLSECPALLLPTVAVAALPLGTETVKFDTREEPVRNVMLRLTQLFNITGHPAITLPCAKTSAGLPVGVQLVGRLGETSALLDFAAEVESHFGPGTSR